jgi:hypothetical protein
VRAFLIYLAIAAPIVLMNPHFWALVGMSTSVTPVTYAEADGSLKPALLGPKAPWPEWAEVPESATLRVSAWFGATPTQAATGYGEIALSSDPRQALARYAKSLEASGWTVEMTEFETVRPDLPPSKVVMCLIDASIRNEGAATRHLRASIDLDTRVHSGRLHWFDGPVANKWQPLADTSAGKCEPRVVEGR